MSFRDFQCWIPKQYITHCFLLLSELESKMWLFGGVDAPLFFKNVQFLSNWACCFLLWKKNWKIFSFAGLIFLKLDLFKVSFRDLKFWIPKEYITHFILILIELESRSWFFWGVDAPLNVDWIGVKIVIILRCGRFLIFQI